MRIIRYLRCRFPCLPRNLKLWMLRSASFIIVGTMIYFCFMIPSKPEVSIDSHTQAGTSTAKRISLPKLLVKRNISAEVSNTTDWWQPFLCGLKQDNRTEDASDGHPLRKLLSDLVPGRKNANVFLMDTACNSSPNFRVWCSVESWAKENPDLDVWFILTSLTWRGFDSLPKELFKEYPNLNTIGADVERILEGTPLMLLYESKEWTRNDTWPVELLSDMLRVLVLWRWGGVYSDTDVISIRPFNLPQNSLAYETGFQIGSAVYSFKDKHDVLWRLMEDMVNGFEPTLWGSIGPKAITRVMKAECGVDDLESLLAKAPVTCGDVTLHPSKTFYPIDYTKSKKLFMKKRGRRFRRMFRNSYAIHFWNKMSKTFTVKKGDNSLYEVAAKRFCPLTYRKATEMEDSF